MTKGQIKLAINLCIMIAGVAVVTALFYKITLWQAEQRESIVNDVASVDNRLRDLEYRIVGACSVSLKPEQQPHCETGWSQQDMQKLVSDLCALNPGIICPVLGAGK